MNYRHDYHAGNFADVLKHWVLVLCLEYLLRKPGPILALDAHAGAGLYDLRSESARKTGEWERGIGRLMGLGLNEPCSDLGLYLAQVMPEVGRGRYPGSCLIMARMLRDCDRLIANELHAATALTLEQTLAGFPNARVSAVDAYQCVRANVPPRERRGLVLIDPPFERKNEFQLLGRQMIEWHKRWATGLYLVWYPIKAHLPVQTLHEAAQASGFDRLWTVEMLVAPRDQPDTLNGCGVLLFNPPYTVPERVHKLLPSLQAAIGLHDVATF
jgi:23S rRNA (adenine2030-N6)-methyltransferase